jgi:hypothetical protein
MLPQDAVCLPLAIDVSAVTNRMNHDRLFVCNAALPMVPWFSASQRIRSITRRPTCLSKRANSCTAVSRTRIRYTAATPTRVVALRLHNLSDVKDLRVAAVGMNMKHRPKRAIFPKSSNLCGGRQPGRHELFCYPRGS